MAKQSAGFVHEHIEKVVIAICAGFLVFTIYYGFAGGRFDVNGNSPNQLIKNVGDAATVTAGKYLGDIKVADDSDGSKDDAAVQKLLDWYGPNRKSIGEIAGVSMDVARAQWFPPLFVSTTQVNEEDKHDLAKLVTPDVPVLAMGKSVLEFPAAQVPLENVGARGAADGISRQVNWVAVAAQVDLKEQEFHFRTEKYPQTSAIDIVKVHLQRRDRDEEWRGWQDVDTWLPFEPLERPTASQAVALRDKIVPFQELIARTALPKRIDGDRIEYDKILPFLDAPPPKEGGLEGRVKGWIDHAERAYKNKEYETAMIFARAAMTVENAPAKSKQEAREQYKKALRRVARRPGYNERPTGQPDRMMPIIAYDLSAIPGHRYQYRIRYEIVNHYAGLDSELRDRSGASLTTRFSDWSPPSSPSRVDPDLQFFMTDASEQRKKVEVTVWKRKSKRWEKQDFRLGIGDAIGKKGKSGTDFATGAVIVDIRFNERINGKPETILVYVAPDGSLREAILSVDKDLNDDLKKRA